MEHDAEEKDQDAGHQDDGAHAGPGGALGRAAPVRLLGRRLARGRGLQGLLLGRGDAHHGHRLRLGPGQQAAARVAGQQRALLGDGQGQHVAPVARQSDEDRRVLGGVRDGNDAQHLGVVRQLRHREARGQLGGAPAPGAAHVLLARPHLLQAQGAARVPAVQQLGPPPGAVLVEADLALQQRVLRGRLHGERGRRAGSRGGSPRSARLLRRRRPQLPGAEALTGLQRAQACAFLHPSPRPFHPLLRDDIKWKWHAFGRQEADEQESQLSPSFVQPTSPRGGLGRSLRGGGGGSIAGVPARSPPARADARPGCGAGSGGAAAVPAAPAPGAAPREAPHLPGRPPRSGPDAAASARLRADRKSVV